MHEGFTDEQIVRLADEDNENDEYHAPVPLVDQWLACKALHDSDPKRWTQENIAKINQRLSFATWPERVLDTFRNDLLRESHAIEIDKILESKNLDPWLTREQAMLEVIKNVLDRLRGPQTPTAKQFAGAATTAHAIM